MAYQKQTWTDNVSSGTAITKARMDHIEDGIASLDTIFQNRSKILWSGRWQSGSITVDNLSDYSMFAVRINATSIYLRAYSDSNNSFFRAYGQHISANDSLFVYSFSSIRNGNTLTWEKLAYVDITSTKHNVHIDEDYIWQIVGII